ncbi:MAG: hypothetical protein Fur0040_11970 [Sideroxydans sp.]
MNMRLVGIVIATGLLVACQPEQQEGARQASPSVAAQAVPAASVAAAVSAVMPAPVSAVEALPPATRAAKPSASARTLPQNAAPAQPVEVPAVPPPAPSLASPAPPVQALAQSAAPAAEKAGLSEAEALALARKRNCLACHAVDRKVVGPAWRDVAAKYRGDAGAAGRLEAKIARGGSGVWGSIAMPPQSQLAAEERTQLVRFILNLK